MPFRRRRRRPLFPGRAPLMTPDQRGAVILFLIVAGLLALLVKASVFLKDLSGEMALSDASDMVTLAINDTINRKMSEGQYDYDYFVSLEKDSAGNITAIKTNMARVNAFSSEVLSDVVQSADSGELDVQIPVGNLLGMNVTLGRGPKIPVDIIMLTSSHAEFKNDLTSAGINQTKHQMVLEVVVDIDILVPWETLSTQVVTDTLIAETVIVGKVPQTFVDVEN